MKSTRTFQEFWSYPLRFCSPPRWRDVYSPPYGRQGIDIVKITDLVVRPHHIPVFMIVLAILQGAYMILFGGMAISTLYLMLEQLYFKINKSKGGHIKGWSDLLQ